MIAAALHGIVSSHCIVGCIDFEGCQYAASMSMALPSDVRW
jgi:hypothetical protein